VKFLIFSDYAEVADTVAMHHQVAVCSDGLEMSVSEEQAVATEAVDCRPATSQRCIQPVVIDSRPIVIMAHHQSMQQVVATAPLFIIEYQQPLNVDYPASVCSTVSSTSKSQSTTGTRHKRKRRRKNKVRRETIFLQYNIILNICSESFYLSLFAIISILNIPVIPKLD